MKNCVVSWVPNKIDIAQDREKGWAVLKFGVDDDYVELMFPKNAVQPLFQRIVDTLELDDTSSQSAEGSN